jgi:hypothetical protein
LRRNGVLKHGIEGKVEEVTGRRGRRCKQLLNDIKETRGYWKLKEEAFYGELALEKLWACRKTGYGMNE